MKLELFPFPVVEPRKPLFARNGLDFEQVLSKRLDVNRRTNLA